MILGMQNSLPNRSDAAPLRVAVIGAGVRSVSYLTNVPPGLSGRVQLAAVADPSEKRRRLLIDRYASWSAPTEYSDGADLLAKEEYDAVIIGSYNNTHADFAMEAMDSGACILVEKPIATTVDQCRRLWKKYLESGNRRVFVGFVLRYAPFYERLVRLLRSNSVGQLMAIDADENLSQSITSGFYRGWRQHDHVSGGFMVEKCSHDFDILHMLTGCGVKQVFSIAKRTHFIPRPRHEQHRRFDSAVIRNLALDYGDIHTKQIFENTPDSSVYESEGDVPDHQAVMLEFEDGTLVNFMACLGQPRNTRRIRIFGSNGSLEGDIDRGTILHDIPFEEKLGAETQTYQVEFDASGHHGADSVINNAFWQAAAGGELLCRAGVREGIDAVLVGIAVEQSKHLGAPVSLEAMRRDVFGSEPAPLKLETAETHS